MPILRGRGFREDEGRSAARLAIVSAAGALALWPGEDPIGKVIRIASLTEQPHGEFAGYSEVTVIGTVGDVISGLVVDGPESGTSTCRRRQGAGTHARCSPAADRTATSHPSRCSESSGGRRPIRKCSRRCRSRRSVPLRSTRSWHVVDRRGAGGRRAGVEHLRPVRRADLHTRAAIERNRHPDGARRDREHGRAHGDGPDCLADGRRRDRRADRRVPPAAAPWRDGSHACAVTLRRRRVRRRSRGRDDRGHDCRVPAGAPGGAHDPHSRCARIPDGRESRHVVGLTQWGLAAEVPGCSAAAPGSALDSATVPARVSVQCPGQVLARSSSWWVRMQHRCPGRFPLASRTSRLAP